jgi:hypothetical protein
LAGPVLAGAATRRADAEPPLANLGKCRCCLFVSVRSRGDCSVAALYGGGAIQLTLTPDGCMKQIEASEVPLDKIFCSDFDFSIVATFALTSQVLSHRA